MKYLNFIFLCLWTVAINFVAGGITLTAGPVTCEYKKKDLDESYNIDKDTFIICSDNYCDIHGSGALYSDELLTIVKAGTYIVLGKLNGQLIIDTAKEDYVHLVMNGITINSSHGPAIYAVMANKVTITINGSNKLVDSTSYTLDSEGEPDACLFVDADLSFNGSGKLDVEGNFRDAIRCKKDLKIANGNITVSRSKKIGIKARNSFCIRNGSVDITSNDTGIKVTKDDNPEKGFIVIDGGKITITSGNKAIHSETHLTINNGYIDIKKSKEGLESQMIDILGGETHIVSTDDGINASKIVDKTQGNYYWYGSSGTDGSVYVNIIGGKTFITVQGGDVDGIDSNGVLYIGGNAELYGSTGSGSIYGNMAVLDADGVNAICANATVIATGRSSGRWKRNLLKRQRYQPPPPPPGGESHAVYQPYIQASISSQNPGTKINVLDKDNNIIASYTPITYFSSILVTSPKMVAGQVYTISAGSYNQAFTASAADNGSVSKPPSITIPPVIIPTTTIATTTTTTSIFIPKPKTVASTETMTSTITDTIGTTTTLSIVTNGAVINTTTVSSSIKTISNSSFKTLPITSTKTIDIEPTNTEIIDSITEDVTFVDATTTIESTVIATITTDYDTDETTITSTIEAPNTSTPIATTTIQTETPTSNNKSCSKFILERGYKCCSDNCEVTHSDENGDWGYENGEWCGCGEYKPSNCSQTILDQGYSCCSYNCKVVHEENKGESKYYWGVEKDNWCGCPLNNIRSGCPESITEKGYKCCSNNHCRSKYEDEDGIWSIENGEWCGVSLECYSILKN
ncbi:hypothetical protein BCR36DRAFT_585016 [Piromyces finnis]|uniref:CBM10 domain-containing protein n=1 Tax=Piromyces finnis TaxID=1754191 RepID=A0A1Y1V547_9FUNG|nr:hypothetical protein BCR36DRAFT_585016 [Piromyces finnis]|eukprot:ORX46912.1 hypothetical protein BCR36DRAFT_585016 [Piromyces finnis]